MAIKPTILPLTPEAKARWDREIQLARDLRLERRDSWKEAVQRYLGKGLDKMPDDDTVWVNKEFPFLEQKKAQLLFQVPEVFLKPAQRGMEQAALLFQAALNHELGADGADLLDTAEELLFDTLAMGVGPTKIGYAATSTMVDTQEPDIDPLTNQPKLDAQQQPVMRTRKLETIIKEEYFWDRISPDKFLLPFNFSGIDYDRAPWMAFEFKLQKDLAIARFGLPKDFQGVSSRDNDDSLSGEKDRIGQDTADRDSVTGIELWYYAHLYDLTEPHPDRLRVLVLIDGHDAPVRHENSPYQRITPQGKLIGMKGHPIHPLCLRFVADCAWPLSDIELSMHLSEELSKGRTQMVQQRNTNKPLRAFDRNRATPDDVKKVVQTQWGGLVPIDGNPDEVFKELVRANFPREDFTFNEIIDRDYEEMWALGRAQRGLTEDQSRTATELQLAQGAASVRLDKERARVLKWFTTGARKFGALLQLFKTEEAYVEVLGQEAQGLQAWNRDTIQGEFVFTARPDSALRTDIAAERQQLLQVYNLVARDPNVVRVELLRTLLQKFNLDPTRVVVDKLPEKGPEPPKIGISIDGEDLLSPATLAFLEANGVKVSPANQDMAQMAGQVKALAAQQPEHPGTAEQAEPLSKHGLRGDGTAPVGQTQRNQVGVQ